MIKGIIFDYGGTLDSRGVHWSEVLWQGYQQAGVPIDKQTFRTAYVEGERALARERIILPQDDFHTLLLKKVALEISFLPQQPDETTRQRWVDSIADYCDKQPENASMRPGPCLKMLCMTDIPMMLVSNFYGNIDEVLRAMASATCSRASSRALSLGCASPTPPYSGWVLTP